MEELASTFATAALCLFIAVSLRTAFVFIGREIRKLFRTGVSSSDFFPTHENLGVNWEGQTP